jgi:hypothetical protein
MHYKYLLDNYIREKCPLADHNNHKKKGGEGKRSAKKKKEKALERGIPKEEWKFSISSAI